MNSLLPITLIMFLAMVNGIITSVLLETIILLKQMSLSESFKTALGMSFISSEAVAAPSLTAQQAIERINTTLKDPQKLQNMKADRKRKKQNLLMSEQEKLQHDTNLIAKKECFIEQLKI